MSAGRPDELHELANRMCDGTLAPAEIERLEGILRSDPAARKFYYELIELHGQLDWARGKLLARSERSNPATGLRLPERAPTATSHSHETSLQPAGSPTPIAPTPNSDASPVVGFLGPAVHLMTVWLSSPKALALTVVGGLLSYFVVLFISVVLTRAPLADHDAADASHPAVGVARLIGAARCQWQDASSAPEMGASLAPGTLRLTSGIAELEFAAGATVRIEGPAEFDPRSAGHIRLTRGRLLALAPQRAQGFTVGTPRADVVDLGTQFGVHVDQAGVTAVEVFRGMVEVVLAPAEGHMSADGAAAADGTPSKAAVKQRITAGEAARVDGAGAALVAPRFTAGDEFVPDLAATDRLGSSVRSAYADLLISQTRPVAYWDFDDGRGQRTRDLIHARRFDSFLPTGVGAGARPTDDFAGMAINNSALVADGDGAVACDHLTKVYGVGVDAYSLQMWFNSSIAFDQQNVHYLWVRGNGWKTDEDRRDSVMVGGTYVQDGFVLGKLVFFPGLDAAKVVSGKTALKPNQWYQVTLVRNGPSITVFLNGAPEIRVQSPWMGGEGQYLTFAQRVDLLHGLGLNGRFDEVVIWDRALADGEVRQLFQNAVRPPAVHFSTQRDTN